MELKDKLQELGQAFEQFKKANDARLEEIKTNGMAKGETIEKVEKLNAAMDKLEAKTQSLEAALNRKSQGNDDPEAEAKAQSKAYRAALDTYLKKGVEINLSEFKSMSVGSDEDGGFLVSPEMSSEITTKIFESSPIRELASVQTISTDSLELIHDLDEVGSGWVAEEGTRSDTSTPKIKKDVIQVHELYAQPLATQKFLDDAVVNVEAWLAGKVSEKFGRDEATAFISGNGVGKPKGILAYGAGDGYGLVQRQESAANNALASDDLIGVQTLLKEAYQANATWLINRGIIGVIRKLKESTTNAYIWQPGLQMGMPSLLLGRPVRMAADLPAAVAASTDLIVYGDIRAGYQIVDRFGIRVLRDPFTSKPFVKFYTTKRVGGAVKNYEAVKVLKIRS